MPNAIVAYCDLASPEAIDVMQHHRKSPNLRGVRHFVGRSIDDPTQATSDALIDNLLWRLNLCALSDLGLSFELQLIPQQALRMADVLKDCEQLQVALCHCGSPWDRSPSGMRDWVTGLEALARHSNVCCKISGFGMFDRQWNVASIRPIVRTCVQLFGAQRCMLGSNFPVERLASDYQRLWHAYEEIADDFTSAERDHLFFGTASRFYGICRRGLEVTSPLIDFS